MSEPPPQLDVREGYDRWSAVYDTDGNPLVALEEPRVDRVLADVTGRSILDVGCGTGRHAIRLARHGARVTGVDFSDGMLARAAEKARLAGVAGSIDFVRHDISGRLPFDNAAFDRVICCLVVDHVNDLGGLFAELGRVCRDDGLIIVSVMHPAMMLLGVQARFHDPVTGHKTEVESTPNQISDYVLGFLRAGLVIESMTEHACDAHAIGPSGRGKRYIGWPMLLLMTGRPPRH